MGSDSPRLRVGGPLDRLWGQVERGAMVIERERLVVEWWEGGRVVGKGGKEWWERLTWAEGSQPPPDLEGKVKQIYICKLLKHNVNNQLSSVVVNGD